ncbi:MULTISPECIES: alpha/beta hydrolase [Arthrobacter]|uniref:alpha/beta hydrolase n=1 Tax=Arthrobacter TaxID=1663 RepID=UPI0021053813|nr:MULTISPECIES: alpha/beta hydrolase [Arthrobacter]MCQ1953331.1 alpha/beta hydrolase [Arthrobacter sp. zg-Y238]MCQ1956565.1 alpha/beta hydrolase [Arthrobacter jinronghuae]
MRREHPTWKPDVLGDGFRSLTLELGEDDEGPVVATLVSYCPPVPPVPAGGKIDAVLYLHGWSDYFFQADLARFWAAQGAAFYALDLRKYGRSLRPGQSEGYVSDLAEYDADIEAALEAMEADIQARFGAGMRTTLMAHSTGGLVAALWADRFPGRLQALILNSPWLELSGSSMLRFATNGLLEPVARRRPRTRLKIPEFGFYFRSISSAMDGEWDVDPLWRPPFSFPVRAGWLRAVLAGHARVARGLDIRVPVLLLASAASTISPTWNPLMLRTDSVLDVNLMVQRGVLLGPEITVYRFDGALHDTLLSALPVRTRVYEGIQRWSRAFILPR